MTKIEVAPVLAIASDAAILRAFRYCGMGLPNICPAIVARDIGACTGSTLFVIAFDMMTVMLSVVTSIVYTALMFSMGSGK